MVREMGWFAAADETKQLYIRDEITNLRWTIYTSLFNGVPHPHLRPELQILGATQGYPTMQALLKAGYTLVPLSKNPISTVNRQRVLLGVEYLGKDYVDVSVVGWKPSKIVRIPSSVIPPEIFDSLKNRRFIHANGNLDAIAPEDLAFECFEVAS